MHMIQNQNKYAKINLILWDYTYRPMIFIWCSIDRSVRNLIYHMHVVSLYIEQNKNTKQPRVPGENH
jgi:hypothetical protein